MQPVSVKVMWDYTAFPLWSSDVDVEGLQLSASLRSDLQDWSDRITDAMWGENGPDAPDHREPPESMVEVLRQEGLALTDRVRNELPQGSVVWFFPDEGV